MSPLTQADAADELIRAGLPCVDLNGDGPGISSACPVCGSAMTWRPDGDGHWRCVEECDPSRITTELFQAGTVRFNSMIESATRELEALFGLDVLGVRITGARIVGRGSRASADIYLHTGEEITFEALRDVARPSTLLPELAASVGATPAIKQPQALKAVTLLRKIAEHQFSFSEDEIAADWGAEFLQAADVLDVDMADQGERWAAFSALNDRDPAMHAVHQGISLAAATLVLRHADGTRYVRCGQFRNAIRAQDGTVSATELAHRMERVAWLRRGTHGRIKATCPNRPESLVWTFYEIEAGWEDR